MKQLALILILMAWAFAAYAQCEPVNQSIEALQKAAAVEHLTVDHIVMGRDLDTFQTAMYDALVPYRRPTGADTMAIVPIYSQVMLFYFADGCYVGSFLMRADVYKSLAHKVFGEKE